MNCCNCFKEEETIWIQIGGFAGRYCDECVKSGSIEKNRSLAIVAAMDEAAQLCRICGFKNERLLAVMNHIAEHFPEVEK